MSRRLSVVPALALMAGVAIGYALAPRSAAKPAPAKPAAEATAKGAKKPLADLGETASLKARVHELEALLKAAADKPATNAVAAASPEHRPGREGFREHMERLKAEDPARFAQITNNMARFRRRQSERRQAKMEFLASVDTSHMSTMARGVHKSLQNQIQKREEIEQQLQNENLTEDERHTLMDQLRETSRQTRALNKVERSNLISETARVIGLEGQDAADFSTTIGEIIEATENGHGGPGGPPPGNSGAPPPGPPPGAN